MKRSDERLVERLRKICLALPDAVEKVSHGEPTWFAGKGKVFAMLDNHHHGAAHLSVWLPQPPGGQAALIDADPARFFRPPYVGPSGWVGVVLDLLSLFVTGTPSVIAEFVPLFNSATGPAPGANLTTWAMLALLMLIFQPVAEGLVFRGVAYPALRATLGSVPGFLMSALWFGVFHLVAYSTPGPGTLATWWYTLLLPVLAGLYLNGVRAYTGSTRASIFAQMGLGLFFLVRAITLAG